MMHGNTKLNSIYIHPNVLSALRQRKSQSERIPN